MPRTTFVHVTYIRTTPEALWSALTDPAVIARFWFGVRADSTFEKGAPWRNVSPDGVVLDSGEILEADAPRRLVIRWRNEFRPELREEGDSLCTMEIEPAGSATRLTVTHTIERDPSAFIAAVSGGWPKVLANLKSLVETGMVALDEPYPPHRAEGAAVQA